MPAQNTNPGHFGPKAPPVVFGRKNLDYVGGNHPATPKTSGSVSSIRDDFNSAPSISPEDISEETYYAYHDSLDDMLSDFDMIGEPFVSATVGGSWSDVDDLTDTLATIKADEAEALARGEEPDDEDLTDYSLEVNVSTGNQLESLTNKIFLGIEPYFRDGQRYTSDEQVPEEWVNTSRGNISVDGKTLLEGSDDTRDKLRQLSESLEYLESDGGVIDQNLYYELEDTAAKNTFGPDSDVRFIISDLVDNDLESHIYDNRDDEEFNEIFDEDQYIEERTKFYEDQLTFDRMYMAYSDMRAEEGIYDDYVDTGVPNTGYFDVDMQTLSNVTMRVLDY